MKINKKLVLGLGILSLSMALTMPQTIGNDFLVSTSYAIGDKQTELELAKERRDQAKKAYEESKQNSENVLGFFAWVKETRPNEAQDVDRAISALKAYPSNTKYNDSKDATSIANIKSGLRILQESNRLRVSDYNFKGRQEFVTSHRLLAIAISNANNSYNVKNGHLQHFEVGENLSWGYKNPNDGWYYEELEIYNRTKENSAETGHYLNIVRDSHYASAIGVNNKPVNRYGNTISQVFGFSGEDSKYYSVSEYMKLVESYENSLKNNELYKEYQNAEKHYQDMLKQAGKDNANKPATDEQIRSMVDSLKKKLAGIDYLKKTAPETVKRYQKIIEQAVEGAQKAIKQAEDYLNKKGK